MENDGILEEEAVIRARLANRKSDRPAHEVQDALPVDPSEESALLGAESNHDKPPAQWEGYKEFQDLPWYKQPSIWWLLPAFALYTLAFGGVLVPKVNLVRELICRDYLSHKMLLDPNFRYEPIHFNGDKNPDCQVPEVNGRTAVFLMGDNILGGILGAIVSPFLGDLSDRVGRKWMMIFTGVGGLVKEITAIVAATNPETFAIGWFYVGFVVDGLCGSFIAGLAIAHCYATDCTPPEKRNVAFGFFQGMLFAGIAIGPLIAAAIVKTTGSLLPVFYITLAGHIVFVLNLIFVVPESLSKRRQLEAREKYRIAQTNKTASERKILHQMSQLITGFFRPLKILWPTGEGSSAPLRRNLVLLCAIDTIMFGVAMGAANVLVLYTNQVFGWETIEQSEMVSIINICRVLCLFIGLPLLNRLLRRFKSTGRNGCDAGDLGMIRIAVLFDTLGFIGYTFARTGPVFVLSGCVAALGGIGSPTLQSSLTKHVPAEKTGQVLGASAMLHALSRVIAPLIFSLIFYKTVGHYDQAVFLCLTIVFAAAWLLTWFLRPNVYLSDPTEPSETNTESAHGIGAVGRI